MRFTKLIAASENLDCDLIQVTGHQRSWSKRCRPFLQHVNKAIGSVHKAGVSSVQFTDSESLSTCITEDGAGSGNLIECASAWYVDGCGFDPHIWQNILSLRFGHEKFL